MEFLIEYARNAFAGTIGRVADNMDFLSIYPLFVAFLIGFGVLYARLRAKGRRPTPRRLLRMMFPRRVFLHRSAMADYRIFFINHGLLVFVTLSALITPGLLSEALLRGAAALGLAVEMGTAALPEKLLFSALMVLAWDFGATWAHYLKHRVPVLWEFHKVHHSAEVMTPVTATRRHPVDMLFGAFIATLCIAAAITIWTLVMGRGATAMSIFGTWAGIYLWRLLGYNLRHSHIWLSYGDFWNRIFISPAQHQVHHSTQERHFDKNFGHIFAFWDRMFGTLYLPRPEERVIFGIAPEEMAEHRSLRGIYLTPFARAARLLARDGAGAIAPAAVSAGPAPDPAEIPAPQRD